MSIIGIIQTCIKRDKLNMFTAGGGHARLSCRQGTDFRSDMLGTSVPFFMP